VVQARDARARQLHRKPPVFGAVVSVRFTFYSIQLACFLWLIALVVRQACC
jgi:hypothetical protein